MSDLRSSQLDSFEELSARLLFFAPKNQNEVGVFAFYVVPTLGSAHTGSDLC